jgi:hypothetical protein
MRLNLAFGAWVAALLLVGCGTPPAPPPAPVTPTAKTTQTFAFDGGTLLVNVGTKACQMTLRGEIHAGTVRQMRPALAMVESATCDSKTFTLQATDGLLGDAVTLGAMLRNRGYHTHLPAGASCDTPCMLVFAAGQERTMADGTQPARIDFTQVPQDQDFGGRVCETEMSRGQQLTLLRYLRAMLPPHTAKAVYQKLESATCRQTDSYGPQEALAMGLATAKR